MEVGTRAKLLIRQVKEISTRLSLKVDDNTPTFKVQGKIIIKVDGLFST